MLLLKLSGAKYLLETYNKKYLFPLLIFFFALLFLYNYFNYNNDRWTVYGKNLDEVTKTTLEVGEWIKNNTEKEGVFLSNDESAFMIASLSSRKVVFVRRVHASYFVDVNKRYAEGVVLLYGKDEEEVKRLIKKYNVRYLYYDYFLETSPIIVSLDYEPYISMAGINYTIAEVPWDPSTKTAPKYKSIVVPPQELGAIKNFIIPIKEFKIENSIFSIIYEVKV